MLARRIALALGLLMASTISVACADTYHSIVGLQCRGDVAAVRTGGAWNDDPLQWYDLPSDRASTWKIAPFAADKKCTLANGDEVLIRDGRTPALPHHVGRVGPNQYVSLWLNGRKVLSREIYDGPELNSVFVSRTQVERCAYPEGQTPRDYWKGRPPQISCSKTALDYSALVLDPLEPSDKIATTPRITFSAAYNPEFCKRFVRRAGDVFPGEAGSAADEEIVFPPGQAFIPFRRDRPARTLRDTEGPNVETAVLDFWNTGAPSTYVRVFLTSRWDDATNFLFKNVSGLDPQALAEFSRKVEAHARSDDPTKAIDPRPLETDGWLSDTAPYSNSIRIFVLEGVTYFLGKHDDTHDGLTVTLYRQAQYPDFSGAEIICTFQRRKVNF